MPDRFDKATRSRIMAAIRGANTAPELAVRKHLHALGLRFRIHRRDLPGRPDIVLPKYRTVVFVHGCFWHRHRDCPMAVLPATNRRFWRTKLEGNRRRDLRNVRALRRAGWKVVTVWQCGITASGLRRLVRRILA